MDAEKRGSGEARQTLRFVIFKSAFFCVHPRLLLSFHPAGSVAQ